MTACMSDHSEASGIPPANRALNPKPLTEGYLVTCAHLSVVEASVVMSRQGSGGSGCDVCTGAVV